MRRRGLPVGLQFILVLCLAAVFCLAPLGVYLLWLAKLTRRQRPTVVSGPWDFVGLLLGLSGFILFGGGFVLSLLQSNVRYWIAEISKACEVLGGRRRPPGYSWLLGICSLVLSVIFFTLASRRRSLVVYNLEPAAFEATVAEVCEHLNRPVERRGNLWISSVPLFELDRFPRRNRDPPLAGRGPFAVSGDGSLVTRSRAFAIHRGQPISQWFLAGAIRLCGRILFGILLMRSD